jgi:heme exporter protein D
MEWWHFLIPSHYEFRKLCDSYDKTYMFIVAFIRFIFYVLIFNFLQVNDIIVFDEFQNVQYFFFVLIGTITILSFFTLIMVTLKKQTNLQAQVKIERERPPQQREQIIPIEVNRDDLSASNFERAESGY